MAEKATERRHRYVQQLAAARKRFSFIHKDGDRGATLPPPIMEFSGAFFDEQDMGRADTVKDVIPPPATIR